MKKALIVIPVCFIFCSTTVAQSNQNSLDEYRKEQEAERLKRLFIHYNGGQQMLEGIDQLSGSQPDWQHTYPQDIQDFFNGVYDQDTATLNRMNVDDFLHEPND